MLPGAMNYVYRLMIYKRFFLPENIVVMLII